MGQFFKSLFASCLGVLLALIFISVVSLLVFTNLANQASKPPKVKPNSVLYLKLGESVPDKTNNVETTTFNLKDTKVLGLQEIRRTIENAEKDDNIKGIFIEMEWLPLGFASATSLRNTLKDFKDSGKFIYAYSKYYTQGSYYLASLSDQIYVNPIGIVDFRGFSATVAFYKDLLDKVGVKMEVFYAGKFKSATEPYRRNDMSDENKMQVRAYLEDTYTRLLEEVSASRNIDKGDLRKIADEYAGFDPNVAKNRGLVDVVGYRDMALDEMRKKLGMEEDKKINFVSINSYNRSNPPKKDFGIKNKIAVIYAEGTIVDGEGSNGSTGDKKYTKIINDVAKDDRVKAIVLRVNSPGGSGMASENIWRALSEAKENGLPIVVSMGDYAASGGYYIACLADKIVANPSTLTGSIGVFGLFPNAKNLLNEKLGIHFDTVKTGALSSAFSPVFDLSDTEKRLIQSRTDSLYRKFLRRVSDGRNIPVAQVNEIAQGRVWTGAAALEVGLVDKLGDLNDAVDIAAELADLEEYRLTEYPFIKDPLQQLLDDLTKDEQIWSSDRMMEKELGEWYPYYEYLKEIRDAKGIQMRLPFFLTFR